MTAPARLPFFTRLSMVLRSFAVQSSWNYETMMGNGAAFVIEPALRLLPGGKKGDAYRDAIARQSGYFNANPFLVPIAAGSLARAELDGELPERIERVRGACCGPLGSVGDRLVWAGWLPFCSLLGLLAFGLGLGPLVVLLTFVVSFNAGQVILRIWALDAGWNSGLNMASALKNPVLQRGPGLIAQGTALLAGMSLPLAIARIVGARPAELGAALGVGIAWTVASNFLPRRIDGWRAALIGVAALAAYSIIQ